MPSVSVLTKPLLVRWSLRLTAGLSLILAGGPVAYTLAQVNQYRSALQTTKQPQSSEIKIIPHIEVHKTKPQFWSDGKDPVIITIWLEATKDGNRWLYEAEEDMVFVLQPISARFNPPQITISKGATRSEPATVTAQQPGTLEINCLPAHQYNGLTAANAVKVDFVAPINAIGFESVPPRVLVNISKPFEVYLYNRNDPNATKLAPSDAVNVAIRSDNGNGKVSESPIKLDNAAPFKDLSYVGTRMGSDTIVASGQYANVPLKIKTDVAIVFQWENFVFGVIGAFLGSLLRSSLSIRGRHLRRIRRPHLWWGLGTIVCRFLYRFIESFALGVAFCLLVIVYSLGPRLGESIQPALVLVLAFLVSFLPELPRLMISLVSQIITPRPNAST